MNESRGRARSPMARPLVSPMARSTNTTVEPLKGRSIDVKTLFFTGDDLPETGQAF